MSQSPQSPIYELIAWSKTERETVHWHAFDWQMKTLSHMKSYSRTLNIVIRAKNRFDLLPAVVHSTQSLETSVLSHAKTKKRL